MTRSLDAAICTCLPRGVWIKPNNLQKGSKTMQNRQVWNSYMLFVTVWCSLMFYHFWCILWSDSEIALSFPLFDSKGNADVSSLFLETILWSGASLVCATFVGWSLTRRCSSFVPKQVEVSQQKRNMQLFWFNDRIIDFWGRLTSPKNHKTNEAETSCAQTPNDIARTSTWRCCPW